MFDQRKYMKISRFEGFVAFYAKDKQFKQIFMSIE